MESDHREVQVVLISDDKYQPDCPIFAQASHPKRGNKSGQKRSEEVFRGKWFCSSRLGRTERDQVAPDVRLKLDPPGLAPVIGRDEPGIEPPQQLLILRAQARGSSTSM